MTVNQMNPFRICFILIWFVLFVPFYSFGQQKKAFDLLEDNIQDFLPSLAVLIDSAIINDHYVNFRKRQIDVNFNKLVRDRRQWMRDIGFQADARYGNFDNFSTNTAEGQSPSVYATTRSETKYGFGAYIKFPLFDLVSQRNQVNLAKTEILQAEDMYQMQKTEVRQKIIEQYNNVILNQKLLIIKAKFLETSRVNMLMTEKEFLNGVISISEYARLSSIVSQAEEEFEKQKTEFKITYMILEEMIGFKLNLYSDTP
jgi:outer membrane protein TolC